MNKNILTTLIAAGIFLGIPSMAFAAGSSYGQSNCHIIYGGGKVCTTKVEFSIDKKVQAPNKGGEFVDNLSINDVKFAPTNGVTFKITVKNTGENKIDRLEIVDTLPQYMTFVSGDGTFNKSNNTVTYTITNLEKDAINEKTFVASIANNNDLPKDQATLCLTNVVKGTDNNGSQATDSSAFCVEKIVSNTQVYNKVPVTTVPSTGPELLPLALLVPAGIAGFAIRRKSKFN